MSQTIAARRRRQREGSFVGRSAEQQLFRSTLQQLAALRDASDDELSDDDLTYAQIFLIAAEGGMGKSALLRRFGEIARENKEGANATVVSLDWEQHPTAQNHDDVMHILHDVLCKSGFASEMKPYHDAVERRKTVRKKAVDVEEKFGHLTDFGAKTIQVASGGLVDKEWAADGIHAGAKGLAGLRHFVTQRLDPEERKLYEDPEALTDVFMTSLNTIATPERPLVILLDTYELIEQCDRWFRKRALPQTDTRLIWVLAGRTGPAFIRRYEDEDKLDPSLLGRIPLETFTRPDIRNYVERRGIAEPSDDFIDRLQELSLGIPLALKAWFELYQNDVELPPSDPNASTERYAIVQRVTRRFLRYCDDDDLHLSDGERQRREATRNHIFTLLLLRHTDVEALAVMWECTSAEADQTLRNLARQFSFIFAGEREREPHALVKQFVRDYLREHQRMPFLSNAIERLVAHYASRMRERARQLFPDSAAAVLSDAECTELMSERDVYKQNLRTVQKQIAEHGGDMAAPVKLFNQRKEYEQAIAKLDERLQMSAEQPVSTQRKPLWNDETWRHLLLDFANALCWTDRGGERVTQTITPLFIEAQDFHPETIGALLDIAQEFQAGWTADPRNLYSTVVALREEWRKGGRLTTEAIQTMVESIRYPVQHTAIRNQLQMLRNVLQLATKSAYPRSIDTQVQLVEKAIQSATVLWQFTETQKAILYLQCGRYLLRSDDNTSLEHCALAQTLVDHALQLLPENGGDLARSLADIYYRLGNVYYFDLNRYQEAEAQYQQAVTIDSEYVSAYTGLGNVYYDQKAYDRAMASFQQAITLDSTDTYILMKLGDICRNIDQYEQAEAYYLQGIKIDPNSSWMYIGLGNLYYRQKTYDQAISAFQLAITLDPTDTYVLARLGDSSQELAQYDQAEIHYQQAIAIDPSYTFPYFGLGYLYYKQKAYHQAIVAFQQAVDIDTDSYAYIGLGAAYAHLSQFEEAIKCYQKAILLDPENTSICRILGDFYNILNQNEKAKQLYQQSLDLDSGYYNSICGLARLERLAEHDAEADKLIEQARKLIPEDDHYNLACLESIAGNTDIALEALEIALKNGSSVDWARKDPDLVFIRDDPRFAALLEQYSATNEE